MKSVLFAACALSVLAAAPVHAQAVIGSGVVASERKNSAERPIGFGATADPSAALVILTGSDKLAADLPLTEVERTGIAAAIAGAAFAGKANEVLSLRAVGARPRIVLVGVSGEPSATAWMEAAGKAAQDLRAEKAPVAIVGAGSAAQMADVALGYSLGQYRFDRYRTTGSPPPADAVTVVGSAVEQARAAWAARHAGIADGVRFARDLSNEPASTIYPESFVARVRETFAGLPNVSIEVLDEAAMRKLGMGALVGVGQGSPRGSRLLVLTYKGAGGAPLALVGKGITFDTGGISIKPGAGMWRMKADMSGAAAVAGTALSLARTRAPVHVVAVMALAENMPDGNAQRPGDVVRTLGGKTVEVQNTDAEGRLVLADAVQYAARSNPRAIVDIATLTGSAAAALGDEYAALFARGEPLAQALIDAGKASGEELWRLPLHPNYADDMKSDIADIKHVVEGGSPGAGFGAHFIGFFVDPALPWAHVDMAGTMWASSAAPLTPKGSAGYGVRLLDTLARDWKPQP